MRQAVAIMLLFALTGAAIAQDALAPPLGARKLFEFSANGVQIYVCKQTEQAQKEQGFAWVFDAPEALLFDAQGKQAGTHFKGPTWKLGDGPSVSAEVSAKRPSPKQGSIPWLLLKINSHQGAGKLDGASFIRRVDTNGGGEPASGCDAAHKGNAARVPYTATYQFFGP